MNMMNKLLSCVLLGLLLITSVQAKDGDAPFEPERHLTFSQAKRAMKVMYSGDDKTFYCGCGFENGRVDKASCGVEKRKNETRSNRTEAEHIVPVSWYAYTHKPQCYTEKICTRRNGEKYSGRSCCMKVDEGFKNFSGDLHNLVYTVGELNADRSSYRFGIIPDEPRAYGQACDFEVDTKRKVAEPRADIRGDLARTHFYMMRTYKVALPDSYLNMLKEWHEADPVDASERARNRQVMAIQGNTNPFVSRTGD